MDFDIVIIGGGIAGASLAAAVGARRRLLIAEGEDQCGYHSTGRSAAFFLESYGGPEVARLNSASAQFLRSPPPEFAERSFLRPRGAIHLSDGNWPELPPGIAQRRLDRAELERILPGLAPRWACGLEEPGCADIDVAALHAAYLAAVRRAGGRVETGRRMVAARRSGGLWNIAFTNGSKVRAGLLVNAAGAWADEVAIAAEVAPLGLTPYRRTMVQLELGRAGLRDLPLVSDFAGSFYFKGEGERSIWLSPHDEIASLPCDSAPEEIDIALAIDRFQGAVNWPVVRVERSWSGLRTFAPDRLPVYGFDPVSQGFFWCVGQGGFGIQSSPAAARLAAQLLLGGAAAIPAGLDAQAFAPGRFTRMRG